MLSSQIILSMRTIDSTFLEKHTVNHHVQWHLGASKSLKSLILAQGDKQFILFPLEGSLPWQQ